MSTMTALATANSYYGATVSNLTYAYTLSAPAKSLFFGMNF